MRSILLLAISAFIFQSCGDSDCISANLEGELVTVCSTGTSFIIETADGESIEIENSTVLPTQSSPTNQDSVLEPVER